MRTQRHFLRRPGLLAVLLAGVIVAPARAQDARLQLPALEGLAQKASEAVDITLDASLLQLAASFLGNGEDDAEVRHLLQDLKGIYVKSFEFDQDGMYSAAEVEALRSQLSRGNWTRLVDVKSARSSSHAEVYFWLDKGVPGGLAIVSTEPRELTIVNIVGRIDIERLRKLEGQFGIPKVELEGAKPPED
jgi:hypothetical protein